MKIGNMEVSWPTIRQWILMGAPYIGLFIIMGLGIRGVKAVAIFFGIQVATFVSIEVQSLLAKAKRVQIAHEGYPFQARIYDGKGGREVIDEVLHDPEIVYKAVKGKISFKGEDIPYGLFAVKCRLRKPIELFGKVYHNALLLLPSTLEISLPLTKDLYLEIDGEIIQTLASSFEALQLNDLGVTTILGDLAKHIDINDTAIWYVFGSDFIARLLKEKMNKEIRDAVEKGTGDITAPDEAIREILKIDTGNIFDAICLYFSHLLKDEKTQTQVFRRFAQDLSKEMSRHEARAFVIANRISDLRSMAYKPVSRFITSRSIWSYVFWFMVAIFITVLGIAIYKHYHPTITTYRPVWIGWL